MRDALLELAFAHAVSAAEILYVLAMPEPARLGFQDWPSAKDSSERLDEDPATPGREHVRPALSYPDTGSEAQ